MEYCGIYELSSYLPTKLTLTMISSILSLSILCMNRGKRSHRDLMVHTLVVVTPLSPNFVYVYIYYYVLKLKYGNLEAKSTKQNIYISIKYCTKSIKLYLRLYMQFFLLLLFFFLTQLLKQ